MRYLREPWSSNNRMVPLRRRDVSSAPTTSNHTWFFYLTCVSQLTLEIRVEDNQPVMGGVNRGKSHVNLRPVLQ
jgi:hypothetical protein